MKVGVSPISSRIELAFQSASTTTGADFGYLVKTASRESSMNPTAKAGSSSATGLFQFIESTWLETVKTSGAEHGLGAYADDISRAASGKYVVADPARRREILDLRNDPEISALMAGEFTRANATYLKNHLGREPSDGELYAAHFLGAGGASRLISLAQSDPERSAASVFSRQARANRSIFYDDAGKARSVSQVLDGLKRQHDTPDHIGYATMVAANKPVPTPVAKSLALASSTQAAPGAIASAETATAFAGTGRGMPEIASRYARAIEAVNEAPAPSIDRDAIMSRTQRLAAKLATNDPAAPDTLAANGTARSDETPPPELTAFARQASAVGIAAIDESERRQSATAVAALPLAKPVSARPPTPITASESLVDTVRAALGAVAPVSTAIADERAPTASPTIVAQAEAVPPTGTVATSETPAASPSAVPASEPRGEELFSAGNASARIANAWRATQPSSPFQALFRTDAASGDERFDTTFLSGFSAQPDALKAAINDRAAAARNTGATQTGTQDANAHDVAQGGATQGDGPFDLTSFLKYQIFKEPEDLLPPA